LSPVLGCAVWTAFINRNAIRRQVYCKEAAHH
jgi:hypothetical protein